MPTNVIDFDDIDSVGVLPPDFGPSFPLYPAIDDFVRTTGFALPGNIYPALLQQTVIQGGKPVMRDRTAVYLWEPNGIILGPGFYNATLRNAYQGLPLYVTHCCPTGAFASSSSSSRSH